MLFDTNPPIVGPNHRQYQNIQYIVTEVKPNRKKMKKTMIIVLMLVGLCTCKSQETEKTKFLSHFMDLAEFPCGDVISSMPLPTKDTISYDILANRFLFPVNTIALSNAHIQSTFCYVGKYKIADGYYVLACKEFYNYHDSRIIIYLYNDKQDLITSSLLVGCHDEFLDVDSEYKNETIMLRTTYKKVQNGLDPPKGEEDIQKQLTCKYHIDDKFHFVE